MADDKPPLSPGLAMLAGVLSLALALFSACALVTGVIGLGNVIVRDLIQHRGGVNVAGDFYEVIVILVIGVFTASVAIRWFRAARKG